MDQYTIRAATTDDIAAVSAQIAESYKAAYRELMDSAYLDSLTVGHWVPILREGLTRGDTCLLLETDGQVAGSAVYGPSETAPDRADWHTIYLSPRFIGRGFGHKLYAHMEETMRGQGFRSVVLEVLTGNHRAIDFYQARGYAVTETFVVEENGMTLECHTMKKLL